jgi:hypothetical protein
MVPFCTDITEVVIFSLCYLVLHRVLQLIVLRFCSREFKELEIVVLRHELAVLRRRVSRPPFTTQIGHSWRPRVVCCRASRGSRCSWSRRRRSCDGIGFSWDDGGRMGDEPGVRRWRVRFASWSCDWPERIRAGRSAHCRRTERTRDCGVRDDRSEAPARSTSWAGGHALWTDWARVHPRAGAKSHRRGFLHGRHAVASAPLRSIFHRVRQPTRPPCRLHVTS